MGWPNPAQSVAGASASSVVGSTDGGRAGSESHGLLWRPELRRPSARSSRWRGLAKLGPAREWRLSSILFAELALGLGRLTLALYAVDSSIRWRAVPGIDGGVQAVPTSLQDGACFGGLLRQSYPGFVTHAGRGARRLVGSCGGSFPWTTSQHVYQERWAS